MSRFWPHFFLLAFIEGLAALAALFLIPAESLSLARLALVGAILFPLAASGWMFVRSLDGDWRVRRLDPTARPNLFRALAFSSSLLGLAGSLVVGLLELGGRVGRRPRHPHHDGVLHLPRALLAAREELAGRAAHHRP
ncbi:MAG TPA: hypothetical protein PKV01_14865 [Anaerolineales bacterium]|nr:hypothetical protein [Anaerolineales bacterium]